MTGFRTNAPQTSPESGTEPPTPQEHPFDTRPQSGTLGPARLLPILTGLFFLAVALILAGPLMAHSSWMVFVQDDFLYYLKVAQNLAHGHGSTFNGLVPTNGYQPLWFLFLLVFSRLAESPVAILGFLAVTALIAAAVTFWLSSRLFSSLQIARIAGFALAAWVTLYSITLFFYGMETTLTVPLMLAVIVVLRHVVWLTRRPAHTFLFGLLLSAMVLSRIDTLIFGGLLLAGILATPSLRRSLRPELALSLAVGLTPLAAYFLFNHLVFHTWLPVSGMAKELKFNRFPSIEPWKVFFHPLACTIALLLASAIAVLATQRRRFSPIDRIVFGATIIFPFVYYFILSCVSDWTLWGWYMYPLRPAICVSLLILASSAGPAKIIKRPQVAWALVLTAFIGLALMRWTRQQTDIYAASTEIAQFAHTHPGTYAMGDRAGRVAYLIDQPVVQTEGLMMDRSYLEYVRRSTPLRDVLAHYGVRYYVATAYLPYTGCFEAAEPAKAGPASAHMHAEFCQPPAATFLHDGITTLIYDLNKSR